MGPTRLAGPRAVPAVAKREGARQREFGGEVRLQQHDDLFAQGSLDELRPTQGAEFPQKFLAAIREATPIEIEGGKSVMLDAPHQFLGWEGVDFTLPAPATAAFERAVVEAQRARREEGSEMFVVAELSARPDLGKHHDGELEDHRPFRQATFEQCPQLAIGREALRNALLFGATRCARQLVDEPHDAHERRGGEASRLPPRRRQRPRLPDLALTPPAGHFRREKQQDHRRDNNAEPVRRPKNNQPGEESHDVGQPANRGEGEDPPGRQREAG